MEVAVAKALRLILCSFIFISGAAFGYHASHGSKWMILDAGLGVLWYCFLFVEFIPTKEEDR